MTVLLPTLVAEDIGRTCHLEILALALPTTTEKADFFAMMRALDSRSPLSSCMYANGTTAVTFLDNRTFQVTQVNGKFNMQVTGNFGSEEFSLCQALTGLVNGWVNGKILLTQLEATYP